MTEFTVYGRPGCMYCHYAVKLLKNNDISFDYIDIYKSNLSKSDVSKKINQPVQTMPQILHGEHYVGGCTELMSYVKSAAFKKNRPA